MRFQEIIVMNKNEGGDQAWLHQGVGFVVSVLDPVVREGLSKGDTEMGSVMCLQQIKGNEFFR